MKKFIYLAIILLGVGILFSCTKESGSQDGLVGSWKIVSTDAGAYDVGDVWKFDKNGTISINGQVKGQYSYDKDSQTIHFTTTEGQTNDAWVVTLSSSTLKIKMYYHITQFYIEFNRVVE